MIIFHHIPKTAGMTFRSFIEKQFPPDKVYSFGRTGNIWDFIALPQKKRDSLELLTGHMYYGIHNMFTKPCEYITILRDPLERVLSYYFYILNTPENLYRTIAQRMSVESFIRADLDPYFSNAMTFTLSGRCRGDKTDYSLVEAAYQNLVNNYTYGFQDDIQGFIDKIAEKYGFSDRSREDLNIGKKRSLPVNVMDAIADMNQLDIAFYKMVDMERIKSDEDKGMQNV